MNLTNLIGGVLVGAGVGWLACLLVIFFVPLPRIARVIAIASFISYGLSGVGAGVGILAGDVGPFGIPADVYRVAFVGSQFVGTWGFVISMLFHVFRNNTLVDTSVAEDSNNRIREIQTRGKSERGGVVKDQTEGADHRQVIEDHAEKGDERRAEDDARRTVDDDRRAVDDARRADDDKNRDS